MARHQTRRHAFTLVELLVVIGIIAVLISLLLPALNKCRRAAQEARSISNLRQLLMAYSAYHTDNRGQLLYGYPYGNINGQTIRAEEPITGTSLSSIVATRYPWRLARYLPNIWPILHAHAQLPALPQKGDSTGTVEGKAYTLSLNPTYGLNAAFLGGHKDNEGFVSNPSAPSNYMPNVGKHVAFKASEIHRPTEQIVFADCYSSKCKAIPATSSATPTSCRPGGRPPRCGVWSAASRNRSIPTPSSACRRGGTPKASPPDFSTVTPP
ncbi:MAG: type II secretion system protein [Tepidisphaeraceae bacterium]